MPLVDEIYNTLVKDPDLEIGSHQTREEAATSEAEFRARQHFNNVKALSLATEPTKKLSSIKELVNYISSVTKTVMYGSISIAQNILKGTVKETVDGYNDGSFFETHPTYKAKFIQLPKSAQQFFEVLEQSGLPIGNLAIAFNAVYEAHQEELEAGADPENDDWVHGLVEDVTEAQGEGSLANDIGIGAQWASKIRAGLEQVVDATGNKMFENSVSPMGAFKEPSYKSDLAPFYGENKKSDLTKVATLAGINEALKKAGFPHTVQFGGTSKLKLVGADGGNLPENTYHNPFTGSTSGRLYTSMIDGNSPTEAGDNITASNLEGFSVADILNSIHWLTQQATPEQEDAHAKAVDALNSDVEVAAEVEEKHMTTNPPPTSNKAGSTTISAKKSGAIAKNMPHVAFGAWGGPQHKVSFKGVEAPFHMAHSLGMQYGLCNHLGQFTKIGQILLGKAYDNGVLKKSHVFQNDNHCVINVKGIQALANHHGIDPINGAVFAKSVAEGISGEALGAEDMPEDIDWYELADLIANKNFPDIDDIPQTLVEDTAKKLDVSPTPELVGNPKDANLEQIAAHAKRLQAAYDSGDDESIEKHKGSLGEAIDTAKKDEFLYGKSPNPSFVGFDDIADVVFENVSEDNHSDMINSFKSGTHGGVHSQAFGNSFSGYPEELSSDEHLAKIGEKAAALSDLHGLDYSPAPEAVFDATNELANAIDVYKHSQYNVDEPWEDVGDIVQAIKDNTSPDHHEAIFGDLAGGKDGVGNAQSGWASAFEQYAPETFPDPWLPPEAESKAPAPPSEQGQPLSPYTASKLASHNWDESSGKPQYAAYDELQDKAKKLHDVHEHDYTGEGLSEEEIQAAKDQAAQEMKQSAQNLVEALGNKPNAAADVEATAKAALIDHLDTDTEGVENWLEDNDLTGAVTPSDVQEPTTPTDAPTTTTEASKEPTEVPKDVDPAKQAAEAPDPAKQAAKKTKVMESLFGEDVDSEDAQIYSEHLDDNPSELDSAYKEHVIAGIVDKQKQKVKDALKAKVDEEADEKKVLADKEKVDAKALADAEKVKADKEQVDANALPSEPGELDAMASDSEDETVGEAMATQHARELLAHQKLHGSEMEPEAKKKLIEALQEAGKHGANFAALKDEMEEMGDEFGSPEHMKKAKQKAAQTAGFHENHKQLIDHDTTDATSHQAQQEAFDGAKHDKFTEFDEEGQPVKPPRFDIHTGEKLPDEEEAPAVKHQMLHSLTPVQQMHVDDMKKAKASGDEEGYKKAVKALEDSGVPIQDIEHSGEDAPETGPPDPEVAKKKMAEGYVWHEETRSWILKQTLQELKGGGGSNLVHSSHAGAGGQAAPFATNANGTPSTKNYMHNENGLFGVGDGQPPAGAAASHGHINQNVLHSKLSADGHLDTHGKSKSGVTKLPTNYGHPSDAAMAAKPKSLGEQAKAGFKSGVAQALANKKSGTPFLEGLTGKFFGKKGYPMSSGVALELFLKEYGTHDRLKNKVAIDELLDQVAGSKEEEGEKSLQHGIIR